MAPQMMGKQKIPEGLKDLMQKFGEVKPGDLQFRDVGVTRSRDVKQITIPASMTPFEAMCWLHRHAQAEESERDVSTRIFAFPIDGACALLDVISEKFGWADVNGNFFDPATTINVEVGPGKTRQVPWGRITIPGIEGYLQPGFAWEGKQVIFTIGGVVLRKHEETIKEVIDAVRQRLVTNSIYRGQALELSFRDEDGDLKEFSPHDGPKFIDLSHVRPEELVFPEKTQQLVEDTLYTPIRSTRLCMEMGIPLRRTILLEGPYGVGKSMCSLVTAKHAVESGWTYLYVHDCRDLPQALAIAKLYQPCVLFAEDVDRAVGEERTDEVNKILNQADGVTSKADKIIMVLTTNNVGGISQAMLRHGRVDAVIPVRAPDAAAAAKLIVQYGRGLVDATPEDLGAAIEPILGSTASSFREVVERAKLSAASRFDGHGIPPITAVHIRRAAESMREHLDLLAPREKPDERPMSVFGGAVGKQIAKALKKDGAGASVHDADDAE